MSKAGVTIFMLLAAIFVGLGGCGSRGRQICVSCRLERVVVDGWLGDSWSYTLPVGATPNACSEWFRDHVPDHEHFWNYRGCHSTRRWHVLSEPLPGAHVPVDEWLPALQVAAPAERLELIAALESFRHGQGAFEQTTAFRAQLAAIRAASGR